jgi:DNA-binding beta-propeller fold protein YncE
MLALRQGDEMTGSVRRSAGNGGFGALVAVISGTALACVLAACAAPPAADGVAGEPVPQHGGFSCRGPVLRHSSAKAYVAGHTTLTPVDLATGKIGKPLPSLADPIAIAISPDGRTAYAGTAHSVVPIDVATNAVGSPIATPAGAQSIAISPDGRTAYAAGSGGITPISLRTCTADRVIATPRLGLSGPIAITPDGRTAYLAGSLESGDGQTETPGFLRVDLARGIAGQFLPTPGMSGAAVAPDGRTAYVTAGRSVVPVSLVTGKAGKPIEIPGLGGGPISITPNGHTAYVGILKPETKSAGIVVSIDLADGTAGTPIHVPSYPFSIIDIAIAADGRTAYATNLASVIPIQLAAGKASSPITMPDGAYFIAVTP